MNILQESQQLLPDNQRSQPFQLSIMTTMRHLRAALIGLLLIFVALTSGCGSRSNLPVAPQDLTVDASLMVQSNYTSQLLEALSR